MLPLIIVASLAALFALGLYVLLIKKYYWGPNGPPQKNDKKRDLRQR